MRHRESRHKHIFEFATAAEDTLLSIAAVYLIDEMLHNLLSLEFDASAAGPPAIAETRKERLEGLASPPVPAVTVLSMSSLDLEAKMWQIG